MPINWQNVPQMLLIKHLPWSEDTKCISTCVDQTHPMHVSTQNVSQLVLTKPIPCQRKQKMLLNTWWPNRFHPTEDTKCISTCIDQTPPMPARTQNTSQHVLTKPSHDREDTKCRPKTSHASEDTKFTSTLCRHNPSQAGEDKNASQLVLTKSLPWQRGHKMYLDLCWPKPSHACEHTICISTCVDQIPFIPARTQNVFQRVLTKLIQCKRGLKMYLILCWLNSSHAGEHRTCIWICVEQTHPILAWKQNESQHALINPLSWQTKKKSQLVLTKPFPCQRGHEMYVNIYWLNPSHTCENKKCN